MSRTNDLRDLLRVRPDDRVELSKLDPRETHGWEKDDGVEETERQLGRLGELQDRFWAGAQKSLLVVLQGIDASGKDGAIRHVMTAFNPQGCYVASFKVPTPEEMAHDFLWRIHKKVPGKGEIGIFNRSHYEDVLVVRVHKFVPESVWSGRYELIRDFEEMLTETGTKIVKFFLYIDRDEQRERLQERYDDPKKRWKFSLGDLEERKLWDDYIAAYEDALSKTSTADSPWYAIPSNRNWFRDLAISSILAETMDDLKSEYPAPEDLPANLVIE
jgi:PPK2 family polyphosphate:nucleotide phosphotransferase